MDDLGNRDSVWKAAEKTGEEVKIVNNNKWLSIAMSISYVA
jgi:hypothetical protein